MCASHILNIVGVYVGHSSANDVEVDLISKCFNSPEIASKRSITNNES